MRMDSALFRRVGDVPGRSNRDASEDFEVDEDDDKHLSPEERRFGFCAGGRGGANKEPSPFGACLLVVDSSCFFVGGGANKEPSPFEIGLLLVGSSCFFDGGGANKEPSPFGVCLFLLVMDTGSSFFVGGGGANKEPSPFGAGLFLLVDNSSSFFVGGGGANKEPSPLGTSLFLLVVVDDGSCCFLVGGGANKEARSLLLDAAFVLVDGFGGGGANKEPSPLGGFGGTSRVCGGANKESSGSGGGLARREVAVVSRGSCFCFTWRLSDGANSDESPAGLLLGASVGWWVGGCCRVANPSAVGPEEETSSSNHEGSAGSGEGSRLERTVEGVAARSAARCCLVVLMVVGERPAWIGDAVVVAAVSSSPLSLWGRTSLVINKSERASMESIPGHPRTLKRRRLQVLAIDERVLLERPGQFSRARASSLELPPLPGLLRNLAADGRVVSRRTWTWVSVRLPKPSRVSSRREERTVDGRKSSRWLEHSLVPTSRKISDRMAKALRPVAVVLDRRTFPRARPVWRRAQRAGSVIFLFFLVLGFRFVLECCGLDSVVAVAVADGSPSCPGGAGEGDGIPSAEGWSRCSCCCSCCSC